MMRIKPNTGLVALIDANVVLAVDAHPPRLRDR
jgi:hypothetical protein